MNRTKLIQDELKALWWFSTNVGKDTKTEHLIPVTKSGAARLPEITKTHGKLYWTRGSAEALLLTWALREDGRRAEVFWEKGERGLIVYSGPFPNDCCSRRWG